jgi:hypothetical protein
LNLNLGRHPDQMVSADYNGDRITDAAIFRPSTGEWFIDEAGTIRIVKWGQAGDVPAPADYDGDGKADVAVYRPSNHQWYIPGFANLTEGDSSLATPVPGDYDGDGRAEPALFYRSPPGPYWVVHHPGSFGEMIRWGQAGDIPVPGDYDGDGITDVAVFRPSTGEWLVRNVGTFHWGDSETFPCRSTSMALDM